MKRILASALVAMLAAAPLSARELRFFNGSTEVASGETVESSAFTVTPIGNGRVEVTFAPELFLWSDIFTNSITMTADCVSGQAIQFCPGGECVSGTSITKENITVTADQKLDIKYEYIAELEESEKIPTVVTELSAFDAKHTDVKTEMTIVMSSDSGVAGIFVNDSSFKAIAGAVKYDFATPTEVILYTLSGETLYTAVLEGTGTIDTSSLSTGLYLYKTGTKSGKIYLR